MKNAKHIAFWLSLVVMMLVLGLFVEFTAVWFRPDNQLSAPGWGWARITTYATFASLILGTGTYMVSVLCRLFGRFAREFDRIDLMAGSETMATVTDLLGMVLAIAGFPTFLWWGLYLW